jgi:hypothetical protein
MDAPVHREGRRKAQPCWGWSGAAELVLPRDREQELISAVRLLPQPKSSTDSLVAELLEIGARYVRYLHQDEFGPTRAQRMAALRRLLMQINALSSLLTDLPKRLRLALTSRLATDEEFCRSVQNTGHLDRMNPRRFELVYEAAVDVQVAQAAGHAKRLEAVAIAVRETIALLHGIDSSTSSDLMLDAVSRPSQFHRRRAKAVDPLSCLGCAIIELKHIVDRTLRRLGGRQGPEPRISLRWLVWQLCELWRRETGQDATSSAVRAGQYTSAPQSAAGRFVWTVAKALQPHPAWLQEHQDQRLPVRACIFNGSDGGIARTIHLIMRDYVAQHPSAYRRGRRKGKRSTS